MRRTPPPPMHEGYTGQLLYFKENHGFMSGLQFFRNYKQLYYVMSPHCVPFWSTVLRSYKECMNDAICFFLVAYCYFLSPCGFGSSQFRIRDRNQATSCECLLSSWNQWWRMHNLKNLISSWHFQALIINSRYWLIENILKFKNLRVLYKRNFECSFVKGCNSTPTAYEYANHTARKVDGRSLFLCLSGIFFAMCF